MYFYFTFSNSTEPQPKPEPKIKPESGTSEMGTPNPFSTSEAPESAQASESRSGLLSLLSLGGGEGQEYGDWSRIKKEEGLPERRRTIQPLVTGEADDEDESYAESGSAWRDSGIGTSRDEQDRRSVQRRRKSSSRTES